MLTTHQMPGLLLNCCWKLLSTCCTRRLSQKMPGRWLANSVQYLRLGFANLRTRWHAQHRNFYLHVYSMFHFYHISFYCCCKCHRDSVCLPSSPQLDRGFTAVVESPTSTSDAITDIRLKYIQRTFDRFLASYACRNSCRSSCLMLFSLPFIAPDDQRQLFREENLSGVSHCAEPGAIL